ncbi:MAG: ATP-dependent helicase HrpB [Pseudomonadota bacterium]
MTATGTEQLPIHDVLDELRACLRQRHEAVLQAPPGAGKTTLVPLAMLNEPWLNGRKVLVLEPRRLAARAAAARMAYLLNEPLGQTVGYRIRLDTCISEQTRIEVVTEGILTRMLQRDPGLEDIGLVVFDEFHERNLDSDLCLALCLQGREMFRESKPLKLLVMSATLQGEAVARLMRSAPILTSEGRQYPVTTTYGRAYQLKESIIDPTIKTVERALAEQTGDVLVFLPGQREIRQVQRQLHARFASPEYNNVQVESLYGGLSLEQQQRVVQPAAKGVRKVVLATNVAETSLTIEGITAVVDSGLVRESVFDPLTGMTRLATRRVSRASAEQRRGRAGRHSPGICYRLWSEQQHERLVAQPTPEILRADLTPLALQLYAWGVQDVTELDWLDAPPLPAMTQAGRVLQATGALFANEEQTLQLTPHGVRLAQMPLHPRLAHMLLVGCDVHATETACLVAAILSERNPVSGDGADISAAMSILLAERRCPAELQGWFKRIWQQAREYARVATDIHKPRRFALNVEQQDVLGVLLASAYPDRIARLRDGVEGNHYQLSSGRSATLPEGDSLIATPWLACADLGGQVGQSSDRIFTAIPLNQDSFSEVLSHLVSEQHRVEWDHRHDRFISEKRLLVGKILLSSESLTDVSEEAKGEALREVVNRKGLGLLSFSPKLQQWRGRIELLRASYSGSENPWPDFSDEGLLDTLDTWFIPHALDVQKLDDFTRLDIKPMLLGQLNWPLPLELERLAPEMWAAPSGSGVVIDYTQNPPVLPVKLQEMFGCEESPTIADGAVTLQVHLLSPAGRPLQVTQDLAGFWRNVYPQVRKEMRGRYPKHPWPEDPFCAVPTARTKRQMKSH